MLIGIEIIDDTIVSAFLSVCIFNDKGHLNT